MPHSFRACCYLIHRKHYQSGSSTFSNEGFCQKKVLKIVHDSAVLMFTTSSHVITSSTLVFPGLTWWHSPCNTLMWLFNLIVKLLLLAKWLAKTLKKKKTSNVFHKAKQWEATLSSKTQVKRRILMLWLCPANRKGISCDTEIQPKYRQYIHRFILAYVCMECMHVCMCKNARGRREPHSVLLHHSPYLLRHSLWLNLQLTPAGGQSVFPGDLPSHCWDYRQLPCLPGFLWVLGIQTGHACRVSNWSSE